MRDTYLHLQLCVSRHGRGNMKQHSRETETKRLPRCIEVAEVAVLVRREAIRICAEYGAEREAIEDALTHLDFLKRNRLRFQ